MNGDLRNIPLLFDSGSMLKGTNKANFIYMRYCLSARGRLTLS